MSRGQEALEAPSKIARPAAGMTDRELMQQLVTVWDNRVRWKLGEVVEAMRERLAQPEPAPGYCQHCKQYTIEEPLPAQPEQEPVAWWHDMGGVVDLNVSGHGRPLYFAPPRREWVGLTDDDLKPICDEYRILFGGWVHDFARAIEVKLKEKNA